MRECVRACVCGVCICVWLCVMRECVRACVCGVCICVWCLCVL